MSLDDELVQKARDAAARLIDCERELDVARGDHHHAVRRLHLAGASMREIAAALDLSHQRVHQIIESVGGNARRWKRSPSDREPDDLFCSFCGVGQKKVRKLVAGPGVYICNECVPVAVRVVADGRAAASKRARIDPIDPGSGRHCSFCGRGAPQVGRLAGPGDAAVAEATRRRAQASSAKWGNADDVTICRECLDLCEDITAERGGGGAGTS